MRHYNGFRHWYLPTIMVLMLVGMLIGSAPVFAAISYVGDIGTATIKTDGNSLTVTTNQAVAAGDTIIVGYATDPAQNLVVTVIDSAGNTYEQAALAVNWANGRSYIFYAHAGNPLPSGGTITITGDQSVTAKAAVVSVFSGLSEVSALDQFLGNPDIADQTTQSGTTPTVGPTEMTTQADELLIGVIGTEGPVGDAAGTWGNSFTAGPRVGTTGGDANTNWTVSLGYRIVSATSGYTAQKSGITSRNWAATIATFGTENLLSSDSYNMVLGRPTNDSVTVNVIPALGFSGYISFEYGTTSGSYGTPTSAVSCTAEEPVEVVIDGLAANTEYFYRLRFSADGSEPWASGVEHSFHTQRAKGETFKFTITSDSHLGQTFSGNTPERYEQTMLNVAADSPDFNIDLGDAFIVSDDNGVGGVDNGTQAQVDAVYLAQRPYFGNYINSAPLFLAIGNHENEEGWNLDDTPFSRGIASIIARKKYFVNPVPDGFYSGNTDTFAAVGGDQLREDYYAWTWGDALIIVLDPFQYTPVKPYGTITGSGEEGDETVTGDQWDWTLGQQQYDWFKQTLENSNAKFKFVFSHHVVGGQLTVSGSAGTPGYVRGGAMAVPYFEWGGDNANGTYGFTTERQTMDDPIHQLMMDNGVSAFFHGHDHQFVHELIDDIHYQECPGAGMSGYGFDLYDDSPYVVSGGNLPSSGHIRVTVSSNQALVEYVRSNENNGAVSHSYTIAAGSSSESYLGDVNDDGSVNSTDALIILSCDVGMSSPYCPASCGNANGDGAINSTDALIILSYDVGMTVPFPLGTAPCP